MLAKPEYTTTMMMIRKCINIQARINYGLKVKVLWRRERRWEVLGRPAFPKWWVATRHRAMKAKY